MDKEIKDLPWPCKDCEKILDALNPSTYPRYLAHLYAKHSTHYKEYLTLMEDSHHA